MAAESITALAFPRPPRLRRLVVFWAIAGALALVGVLPYAVALQSIPLARIPMPLPLFALVQFAQGFVVLMLLSWAGLRLGQSLGLGSPVAHSLLYPGSASSFPLQTLARAALAGGLAGAALLGLDKILQPLMPPAALPALGAIDLWKRLLACFYGGISEELICRLFLMSLLVWICRRIASRGGSQPRGWMVWTGIVGASLLFGLAHLPATAAVWPLTTFVVARALLLNAVGGIVFGWLYWRRGLEHAMVAHFAGDIVLHVVGGS